MCDVSFDIHFDVAILLDVAILHVIHFVSFIPANTITLLGNRNERVSYSMLCGPRYIIEC